MRYGKCGIRKGDIVKINILDKQYTVEVQDVQRDRAFGNFYSVLVYLPEGVVHEQLAAKPALWPCEDCEKVESEELEG